MPKHNFSRLNGEGAETLRPPPKLCVQFLTKRFFSKTERQKVHWNPTRELDLHPPPITPRFSWETPQTTWGTVDQVTTINPSLPSLFTFFLYLKTNLERASCTLSLAFVSKAYSLKRPLQGMQQNRLLSPLTGPSEGTGD